MSVSFSGFQIKRTTINARQRFLFNDPIRFQRLNNLGQTPGYRKAKKVIGDFHCFQYFDELERCSEAVTKRLMECRKFCWTSTNFTGACKKLNLSWNITSIRLVKLHSMTQRPFFMLIWFLHPICAEKLGSGTSRNKGQPLPGTNQMGVAEFPNFNYFVDIFNGLRCVLPIFVRK